MPEYRPSLDQLTPLAHGKEKNAYDIEARPDRVWIEWRDEDLRKPEFAKAVYYMQRVLNILMPGICLPVNYADESGLNVLRAPSSPDFERAKALIGEMQATGNWSQDEWFVGKRKEILANPDFIQVMDVIKLMSGMDYEVEDLASPVNVVVHDGMTTMVELFNPLTYRMNRYQKPELQPFWTDDGLQRLLASKYCQGLDESEVARIRTNYNRYKVNINAYIAKYGPAPVVQSAPIYSQYPQSTEIPAELAAQSAPW